ncbi:hypothetical protein Bbelb_445940, partial [Branchiostoma belcheri]
QKKESVTFGGEGKGLGQFRTLGGLTLSSTNKIFVTDTKNKRIQVFSMKGDFIRSFSTGNRKPFAVYPPAATIPCGSFWKEPGFISTEKMAMPRALSVVTTESVGLRICVDSLGRVIVADAGNGRVEMFTAEGRHICTVAYINQPAHVATVERSLVGVLRYPLPVPDTRWQECERYPVPSHAPSPFFTGIDFMAIYPPPYQWAGLRSVGLTIPGNVATGGSLNSPP